MTMAVSGPQAFPIMRAENRQESHLACWDWGEQSQRWAPTMPGTEPQYMPQRARAMASHVVLRIYVVVDVDDKCK